MFEPSPSAETVPDAPDALADLYRSEVGWLTRFFQSRLRTRDDAHDLVHETMLQFLRASRRTSIEVSHFYLSRIATNLMRDHEARGSTRISRNSIGQIEDMEAPIGIDPHRDLEAREELHHWEEVLARLKPRTREIFLLSRVDGWTYREIADQYGMTVWGVKKHMTKAIAHIDRHRREG